MSELLIEGLAPALAEKAREHRRRAFSLGLDFIFTAGTRVSYDTVPIVGDREARGRADLLAELRRIGEELGLRVTPPAHFELPAGG